MFTRYRSLGSSTASTSSISLIRCSVSVLMSQTILIFVKWSEGCILRCAEQCYDAKRGTMRSKGSWAAVCPGGLLRQNTVPNLTAKLDSV